MADELIGRLFSDLVAVDKRDAPDPAGGRSGWTCVATITPDHAREVAADLIETADRADAAAAEMRDDLIADLKRQRDAINGRLREIQGDDQ